MTLLWMQEHKVSLLLLLLDLLVRRTRFQEDRFIFPIYPLILLAAAIALDQIEVKPLSLSSLSLVTIRWTRIDLDSPSRSVSGSETRLDRLPSLVGVLLHRHRSRSVVSLSHGVDRRRLFRSHSSAEPFEQHGDLRRLEANLRGKRLVSFSLALLLASRVSAVLLSFVNAVSPLARSCSSFVRNSEVNCRSSTPTERRKPLD